jgi:hypothetical protein
MRMKRGAQIVAALAALAMADDATARLSARQ